MNEGKRMWRPKQKPLEDRDQSCQKLPSTERVQSSQRFSPVSFLFGAAKAIGHNRNLAARLPLPKIYSEAIRRTSPELTLQELVNNSSTKIGCFRAVFRVSENGKATEPKGCRWLKRKLTR